MCLIITFIMLALGISNILEQNWLLGGFELSIGFGFLILLIQNIQKVKCKKYGKCNNGCSLVSWIRNNLIRRINYDTAN